MDVETGADHPPHVQLARDDNLSFHLSSQHDHKWHLRFGWVTYVVPSPWEPFTWNLEWPAAEFGFYSMGWILGLMPRISSGKGWSPEKRELILWYQMTRFVAL